MQSKPDTPVTIAHKAGNNPDRLQAAVAAGANYAEADIRWDGKPVARHERRLPFLPIYWDLWSVRWNVRGPETLSALLDRFKSAHVAPYLDIKARHPRAPAAILDVLRKHDAISTVVVSTQYWPALERMREGAPELRIFRSVGRQRQLEALHRLLDDDPLRPAGIAMHRRLVTAKMATALRERGLDLYVWAIRNRAEADRILDLGATGIIADDLEVLRSLNSG